MEKKGKDKKTTKKAIKLILTPVLSIVILMVLVLSLVALIWEGIVAIISQILQSIADFFANIWDYVKEGARKFSNGINQMLNNHDYNAPESEDVTITLPEDMVQQIKNDLDRKGVNLEKAGLEDLTLRKMILTAYRTMATKETEVCMIISDEEYKELKDEGSSSGFYRMKMKDNSGQERKYMATKGIVRLKIMMNNSKKKMYCYTEETLKKIKKDFEKANSDKEDYYDAVKEVLERSYTVREIGSVIVNSQKKDKETTYITSTYTTTSNVNPNTFEQRTKDQDSDVLGDLSINYSEYISEYTLPNELLTSLLELTACKDFLIEVCSLVDNSNLEVVLYPDTREVKETKEKSYNVDLDILTGSDFSFEFFKKKYTYNLPGHQEVKNAKVNIKTITNRTEVTYSAAASYIDSWWCKAQIEVEKDTSGQSTTVDKDGNEIELNKKNKVKWIKGEDEEVTTEVNQEWKMFNFNPASNYSPIVSALQHDTMDDMFTMYILATEYPARDPESIRVDKITEKRKNVKEKTQTEYTLTTYKKKATQFEDRTQAFLDLLKNSDGTPRRYEDLYGSKKASPGELLKNGEKMLFDMLESFDNTKGTAYVMRYILHLYSSEDYGINDIRDLLKVFNMEIVISNGSGGMMDLLKEYLHYFENAGGAPTNADGTMYRIESDGYGHPTVGYGIDIFNGGFKKRFDDAGYPTSIGSYVPVEFVDALEQEEIDNNLAFVKATTSSLNLTDYQIIALVSRLFNAGGVGITGKYDSPVGNFVQTYTAYWNESDDQFEAKNPQANFNHKLYTTYMYRPNTSNNQFSQGLQDRRKSEWTAFQTGYFDVLNKWYEPSMGGSIIECADRIHKYMEENGYTYCVLVNGHGDECNSFGKSHALSRNFEASKSNRNTCCATFVSWVLEEAGYITEAEHNDGANNLRDLLIRKGWTKITDSSQFQPGDVLTYDQHVEIYAGNQQIYNAGSGNSIRRASPGNVWRPCYLALRAPN